MLKKTDMKMIGLVTLGVVVAGYLMNMGRDLPVIKDAVDGFDS